MKSLIAIATADGASVADHLARSSAFIVVEIEDGRISSRAVRTRETAECGNHKTFVEMLAGCQAVICGGIGEGAYNSLVKVGIRPVVAADPHTVEDALSQFLAGTLTTTNERVCLCG